MVELSERGGNRGICFIMGMEEMDENKIKNPWNYAP